MQHTIVSKILDREGERRKEEKKKKEEEEKDNPIKWISTGLTHSYYSTEEHYATQSKPGMRLINTRTKPKSLTPDSSTQMVLCDNVQQKGRKILQVVIINAYLPIHGPHPRKVRDSSVAELSNPWHVELSALPSFYLGVKLSVPEM